MCVCKSVCVWGPVGKTGCSPRVPLGQGLSTSTPLWVWGQTMSLFSVLSQKRAGSGNESREGRVVLSGTAAGAGGGLNTLVPAFGATVVVVTVLTAVLAATVVVVVVVVLTGSGEKVPSRITGPTMKIQRLKT